jgi:hypothetical protein
MSLLGAWKSFGLERMMARRWKSASGWEVVNGWQADKRMEDGESLNPLIRLISADHCGGMWVVNGGNTLTGTRECPFSVLWKWFRQAQPIAFGLERMTARGWKSVSTLPAVATQGFGVGGLVRAAGCGWKAVHE